MTDARKAFSDCAGYDILGNDPACSSAQVADVETLIPKPYYTFAQCAYYPATPFCSTIQAYLDAIEADTNSVDCLACYTELQTDLETLATDDADEVCGADVFTDDCITYHADALSAFEACAGVALNLDATTAAPVDVETASTAAPTETTTADATTTTVATETTKGAVAISSMLAIVVLSTLAL